MKFKPLTNPEKSANRFTHRLDFDVSDIPSGIANNTAYTWNFSPLPNVPASTIVKAAELHVTTFFSGSNANQNSTTISAGDAGSSTRFINAVQANLNGTPIVDTANFAINQIYSNSNQLQISLGAVNNFSLSLLTNGRFYLLLDIFTGANYGIDKAAPFTGSGY